MRHKVEFAIIIAARQLIGSERESERERERKRAKFEVDQVTLG